MEARVLYLKYAEDVLLRKLSVIADALKKQVVGYHVFNLRNYLLIDRLLKLLTIIYCLRE
jgi:hypothetical protein